MGFTRGFLVLLACLAVLVAVDGAAADEDRQAKADDAGAKTHARAHDGDDDRGARDDARAAKEVAKEAKAHAKAVEKAESTLAKEAKESAKAEVKALKESEKAEAKEAKESEKAEAKALQESEKAGAKESKDEEMAEAKEAKDEERAEPEESKATKPAGGPGRPHEGESRASPPSKPVPAPPAGGGFGGSVQPSAPVLGVAPVQSIDAPQVQGWTWPTVVVRVDGPVLDASSSFSEHGRIVAYRFTGAGFSGEWQPTSNMDLSALGPGVHALRIDVKDDAGHIDSIVKTITIEGAKGHAVPIPWWLPLAALVGVRRR